MSNKKIHDTYIGQMPSLRRFIARFLIRKEDVEDVLQETYVRVVKSDESAISSPKAYLYRAARNIALNELNRKSNSVTDFIEDIAEQDFGDDLPSIDDQVFSKLQFEVFAQAMSMLPTKCRKVFLLKKIYGLTHKEIAVRLDIAIKTVDTHLFKGLLKCREYMKSRGYGVEEFKVITNNEQRRGDGS